MTSCPECGSGDLANLGMEYDDELLIIQFRCNRCGEEFEERQYPKRKRPQGTELPIYLSDLDPAVQMQVVEFLGIKTPKELNLDVLPLCMLPKPEMR